jgi:hypothetical protein
MTVMSETTSEMWEGEEAPSSGTEMQLFYWSITVPAQTAEQRQLLQDLLDRSKNPDGLDWEALLGLKDAWGLPD